MTRFLRWGLVLVMAVVLIGGCSDDRYSWNQKLTVTVQTPEGEKSGSAVVQAKTVHAYLLGAGESYLIRIRGEATVVDLGGGKYLFALLQNKTENLANYVFTRAGKLKANKNAWAQLSSRKLRGAEAPVDPELYPMLVTFGDVARPESVMQVDPANLAASFGPGYALKAITLTITDEPVTKGNVVTALPWIKTWPGAFVPSKLKPADQYEFAEKIGTADFFAGVKP